MDVKLIVENKEKLEEELHNIVAAKLLEFKKVTGVEIESVDVSLHALHVIGEKRANYFVRSVTCKITL